MVRTHKTLTPLPCAREQGGASAQRDGEAGPTPVTLSPGFLFARAWFPRKEDTVIEVVLGILAFLFWGAVFCLIAKWLG